LFIPRLLLLVRRLHLVRLLLLCLLGLLSFVALALALLAHVVSWTFNGRTPWLERAEIVPARLSLKGVATFMTSPGAARLKRPLMLHCELP